MSKIFDDGDQGNRRHSENDDPSEFRRDEMRKGKIRCRGDGLKINKPTDCGIRIPNGKTDDKRQEAITFVPASVAMTAANRLTIATSQWVEAILVTAVVASEGR